MHNTENLRHGGPEFPWRAGSGSGHVGSDSGSGSGHVGSDSGSDSGHVGSDSGSDSYSVSGQLNCPVASPRSSDWCGIQMN